MAMLDSTTDDTMLERLYADAPGSQEETQRQKIKAMPDEWERRRPGRRGIMFKALTNVRPAHLADPGLFDFAELAPGAASGAALDHTGPENP